MVFVGFDRRKEHQQKTIIDDGAYSGLKTDHKKKDRDHPSE